MVSRNLLHDFRQIDFRNKRNICHFIPFVRNVHRQGRLPGAGHPKDDKVRQRDRFRTLSVIALTAWGIYWFWVADWGSSLVKVLVAATIPGGVTNIGDAAFSGCRKLSAVSLPSGLVTLGESVFLNCRSLTSLDLPDGITSLPAQLCYECRSLATLDLPSGVTNIGRAAFYNCFGLASLDLPSSVTALGQDAFYGCTGLTSLSLDAALARVGDEAFFGCTSLERVQFTGGVGTLADGVFGACTSLSGVYFLCDEPELDTGEDLFTGAGEVTVRYLTAVSTWGSTFGGAPVEEWCPEPTAGDVVEGAFQFGVEWADGQSIRVQASSDLEVPVWTDVASYVISNGACQVRDTNWVGEAIRYYRIVSP